MAKKDYTKYSNQSVTEEPVVAPVKMEEPVVEEEQVVVKTEPVKEEKPVVKQKIGVVVNCQRLNIRKRPVVTAQVLAEVEKSSEVVIDDEGSTSDFYKVCTAAGVEGFCMKKFVVVKK